MAETSAELAVRDPEDGITFGIRLPNSGPFAQAKNIETMADHAVALGFSRVWVHDHIPWASEMLTHFSTGSVEACKDQDPNFFETVSTVAYVAGRHPELEVGVAGLVLPLRDPRVLAKQLMTLQVLTGGRLITALAIGNIPNDFDVMQVPHNRRGRITDEYLGALAAIYSKGQSSFSGERLAFEDAEFFPKPTKGRFWIAGNSPPAYRRIAQYASGWLPGAVTRDEYAECRQQVKAALEARGRGPDEISWGLEAFFCLEDTTDAATSTAARSLEHRFKSVERGLPRNIVGDPDDVAKQIQGFVDAGVTHFELRCVGHTLDSHLTMMSRFTEEVAPRFR